jgi:CYTH domain-containing protein
VLEIERRWLLMSLPSLDKAIVSTIWQAYLTADTTSSVRIRSVDDASFELAIKRLRNEDSTLVREEFEISLTEQQFSALRVGTIGHAVIKHRHTAHVANHRLEIDVFLGRLSGLIIAEIEFESVAASDEYQPLEWFSREITEDRRYLNSALSMAKDLSGMW